MLQNGFLAVPCGNLTKIFDIYKKSEVKSLIGHAGTISVLEVLANGYLASGSSDMTIKIWS